MLPRIRTVGLAIAAALGLAACTDGYGYSGVSLGYGSAGYYDDPYYAGGYGGSSYYGWNNGYYYPGTGFTSMAATAVRCAGTTLSAVTGKVVVARIAATTVKSARTGTNSRANAVRTRASSDRTAAAIVASFAAGK